MKTKTKVVLLALCMAALIVVSVLGTMAYLTSTDTVTNTFTVGKVAITLDEADVNEFGVVDGTGRVEGNEYKLLPGHTYIKDPTVTVVAKSEDAYVRMLVTINEQADLDKIFAPNGGIKLNEIFTGTVAGDWALVDTNPEIVNDTRTYEFRYKEKVLYQTSDQTLSPLFTKVVIPGNITGDQLATIEGLKITVVANAIQADGFGTAEAAWAAFPKN